MGLIIDNFAGGGGASTGIEAALGRYIDIAINHDPDAILMHKTNHPNTKYYCESVWDVDPLEVTQGNSVDLAWFSPDCKHFSKAKGGKPVDRNIRGLAWIAVKWAKLVKPKIIMLENVEEFKTWGPIKDGYPDPKRKGETFELFIKALEKQGYEIDFRELRACDYGAPTTRKRFFMIARCDGQPIVWPKPTHSDPEQIEARMGLLNPWRTAAECIDWSILCPSIFDRKKPLAENTLRRIAKGFQKFIINNPTPFVVRIGQTGFAKDGLQYELDTPLTTITTKAEHCLITPYIATYYTETSEDGVRGQKLNEPIATIPTNNRFGLVTAFIARHFKSSVGHEIDMPLATITTIDKSNLVMAFLLKYYGADIGQRLTEPLHTITSKDRFGLVTIQGEDYKIVDIGMRMLQPHELFKAQGFPDSYIIDRDYTGKTYPKTKQVARVGNSVCPQLAEALVRANVHELDIRKQA
ncbi:DNA cytosine methyltransferase [Acetoanaerobium sticklandii]|uniref:DNA cytosine methyltransferase n=1 Tax=Acetoanaerobium sticklandii TaxID=1511 RepID=UPI003A910B60